MRTTAEVGEVALGICGDCAVFKFADELAFVGFAAVTEHLQGIGLGDIAAHDRLFGACKLEHFLFYLGEVGCCNLIFARVDVIVETILDGRTDAEFNTGIKLLKGFGQQVRRAVPEGVFAFWVFPFEELDGGVVVDGTRNVPVFAVDRRGQYLAGELRTKRASNVKRRHAALKFALTAIWKSDFNHL